MPEPEQTPALLARIARAAIAPVVPLAFGAPGFHVAAAAFTPLPADAMAGLTVLITGANGGLGLAASQAMAKLGATVVMACRDLERGRSAQAQVAASHTPPELLELDVADPGSIRDLAARWGQRPLHALVHNAAVLTSSLERTPLGEERTLATNLLGPVRLTRALLPGLEAAPRARIVLVSSGGMFTQRLDLGTLDPDPGAPWNGAVAYARTKRALVTTGELWAEGALPASIAVHAMHPGWADTPGVRSALPRFHRLTRSFLRDPHQGADTITWLAAAPAEALGSGGFWFDRQRVSPTPVPGTADPPDQRRGLLPWLEARHEPV